MTCTLGNMASGASATVTLTGKPSIPGSVSAIFATSGGVEDGDMTNNSVTAAMTARVLMKMNLSERTRRGKVRKCGVSRKKACIDKYSAKKYFGGKLTPATYATKGQVVTLRFYKAKGKRYKLKKTYRGKVNAKKTYLYIAAAKGLPRGNWYVQSSILIAPTTTAGSSTKRYFKVG